MTEHEHAFMESPLLFYLSVDYEGPNTRAIHALLCECGAVKINEEAAKRYVGKTSISPFDR